MLKFTGTYRRDEEFMLEFKVTGNSTWHESIQVDKSSHIVKQVVVVVVVVVV